MSKPFCCTTLKPTKLPNPDHEQIFTEFTKWALATDNKPGTTDPSDASVCIQLVRQVNGAIESVQYFIAVDEGRFQEVSEAGIVDADFVRIDEYEILRCTKHDRSFILHLYEPSTGSSTHWRAGIAKPLKQLENAIKNKISGSGSGSGSMSRSESGLRDVLGLMGSGVGYRASSGYGYGMGMGYGSAWGSSLGSGCGPNWGTGSSMIYDKNVPSSTTVEAGSRDSDIGQNEDQDQDQDQDPNQDAEIPSPDDGTECTNRGNDKDEHVSSSPTIDTEVTQDEDAGSCSPPWGTQVYHDEGRMSQSYLDIEDYGCYYSGRSSDDYGSYDCDGGDIDLTYDQDGDCGGCDD
ncbi:hypothetical protein PENFLA_c009G00858 [Penicillium flavigenum]|uniref:Uncharacterized protein n=1 Tax=Penicillium flavigenum TaxID=254877 RepID=A0A1V6TFR7_9EURO|nr:hypothetical protein PENFLA_c009G00858 [Penicillium flavigenum]